MFCSSCGRDAEAGQKFCTECGASLADASTPAEELTIKTAPETPPNFRADSGADLDEALRAAGVDEHDLPSLDDVGDSDDLPDLAALPTRQIEMRDPIPEPEWAAPPETSESAAVTGPVPITPPDPPAHADASLTTRFPPASTDDASVTTQFPPTTQPPPAPLPPSESSTAVMDALPSTGQGYPDQVPAPFDGSGALHEFPVGREPFKFKLVFVFAFFGAIAVLLSAVADVIDIRTSVPVDGIATGVRTLDTLGTNLAVAAFFGATVMALGGLLACFGFRWGAGLAGGAGLALAGWAALVAGLAELRIASAESITRQTTDIAFTLKVTRDLGFWLIVGIAAIGLLVFLASLRSLGTGGRPALNPWIAALGAVAGVVLVAGPLLPEGDATFANNFRSATTVLDLPTMYFAGRVAQLGLIGFTIVFGLLVVRAYGLGLAAGGVSVALWMWVSSLLEVGSFPLGIAAGNFGSGDTLPHAVTTVGMALTLLMLFVAAVLATVGSTRQRSTRR